jgi:hypothetical protein
MTSTTAPQTSATTGSSKIAENFTTTLARRHLKIGWWSLLLFLSLGITLEALHGFKASLYLDVSNETRRLMWTLAHAHGALLALVHLGFAATLQFAPVSAKTQQVCSIAFSAAGVLIPAGFFLGGLFIHGSDPGVGILFVPVGAAFLFLAVFLVARSLSTLATQAPTKKAKPRG